MGFSNLVIMTKTYEEMTVEVLDIEDVPKSQRDNQGFDWAGFLDTIAIGSAVQVSCSHASAKENITKYQDNRNLRAVTRTVNEADGNKVKKIFIVHDKEE